MFSQFRATQNALQAIPGAVVMLAEQVEKARSTMLGFATLKARLEDLESSRAKWEAEMQAELLKAQGRYQAANNAEGRTQTTIRAYKKLLADVGDASPEEYEQDDWEDDVPSRDVERGEADGVQPLHLGLETDAKTQRLRAKFS